LSHVFVLYGTTSSASSRERARMRLPSDMREMGFLPPSISLHSDHLCEEKETAKTNLTTDTAEGPDIGCLCSLERKLRLVYIRVDKLRCHPAHRSTMCRGFGGCLRLDESSQPEISQTCSPLIDEYIALYMCE
jgi:hypothetical protein